MKQMTVICDICGIVTRHEPPRKYWQSEQDWMTVTLECPSSDIILDVCPVCCYRIYIASTYAGLIAAISERHSQQGENEHADEDSLV